MTIKRTDRINDLSFAATSVAARRSPWPYAITGGLAVVVVVNMIMLSIALDHPSTPASPDHYGEALAWDDFVGARSAARAQGISVSFEPCTPQPGGCRLAVVVADAQGRPVPDVDGTLEVRRSDTDRYDRRVSLRLVAPGRLEADVELGADGLYDIEAKLAGHELSWVERTRLALEGQRS